jgi:hypothetical protein
MKTSEKWILAGVVAGVALYAVTRPTRVMVSGLATAAVLAKNTHGYAFEPPPGWQIQSIVMQTPGLAPVAMTPNVVTPYVPGAVYTVIAGPSGVAYAASTDVYTAAAS